MSGGRPKGLLLVAIWRQIGVAARETFTETSGGFGQKYFTPRTIVGHHHHAARDQNNPLRVV
jgi:hypothetical protein